MSDDDILGLENDEEEDIVGDDGYGEYFYDDSIIDNVTPSIPVDRWTDASNAKTASITIGVATDYAWRRAKLEFEYIRQQLHFTLGERQPSLTILVDFFFGPRSDIFLAFVKAKIFQENKHTDFMKFLMAFYQSAAYNVSSKQMFADNSRLNNTILMEKVSYLAVWKDIASAGLPKPRDHHKSQTPTAVKPFWTELETACNSFFQQHFVPSSNFKHYYTLDDDKCHFHGGSDRYSAGLKMVRHVRDNRMGNIIHTMVHSYSQFVSQVAFEREIGDSTRKCTLRIFHDSLTPVAAPGTLGNMGNVNVGMDRGYWDENMLRENVAPSNMKIEASTIKRQAWVPMTFGQKMAKGDKRIDVPLTGAKTMFIKKTNMSDRVFYCVLYRNGHGGNTLGISTEHGKPEWEFVLENPLDLKWYEKQIEEDDGNETADKIERKIKRCFRMLQDGQKYVDPSEAFINYLRELNITLVTTTQRSAEWFFMRKFSLTSSTTDKIIQVIDGTDETDDIESWDMIKAVLSGIIDGTTDAEEDRRGEEKKEEEEGDGNQDDANNGGEHQHGEEQEEELPFLTTLLKTEAAVESVRQALEFGELDLVYIHGILKDLGHKPSKATSMDAREKMDKKTFSDWLKAAPTLRKHYFKPLKELKVIATDIGVEFAGSVTRNILRDAINRHLLANDGTEILDQYDQVPLTRGAVATLTGFSKQQKVLNALLTASFMAPLKGKAKKYTRRGHQLETHIVSSCILEHQEERNQYLPRKLLEVCSAGLVQKKLKSYVKDSIDFVGLVETDEGQELIGVEVKARVTNKTSGREREHLQGVLRRFKEKGRTPQARDRKYFTIQADSPDFAFLVTSKHEVLQLMHHAYTYEINCVLLLIGDDQGEVIFGVFVEVSIAILEAYGHVLDDIYNSCLQFLYEPDKMDPPPDDDLSTVLESVKVNGAELDMHSFSMQLALHQDAQKMSFPLPKCVRFIPLIFAIWNSIKGGSDSITKLIWHNKYSTPTDENQSNAVARLLILGSVQLHRLHQLSRAKADLSKYCSVRHYRNAATMRGSYHHSLLNIIEDLGRRANPVPPPTSNVGRGPVTPPRATRAMARTGRVDVDTFQTGKTPRRKIAEQLRTIQERADSGSITAMENVVLQRRKQCTGFLVKRTDETYEWKNARGSCVVCKASTPWYCLRCKVNLCIEVSKNSEKVESYKERVVIELKNQSPMHCMGSCFFNWHRDGLVAAANADVVTAAATAINQQQS